MSGTKGLSVVGWLLIALGLVALVTNIGLTMNLGLGVAVLLINGWRKRRPLLVLHDDHLDMKIAPLAGRRLVRFKDIERIAEKSQKRAVLDVKAERPVKIPLRLFEPADADIIVSTLDQRLSAKAIAA